MDAQTFDRFAPFYDQDYRHYDEDLPLLVDLAQECGDPVLELGCGTGRVAIALAAAGHQVTGVDLSPALLDVARRKLADSPFAGQVQLIRDDLRHCTLERQDFAFACCVSNTLMHFTTPEEQMAVLRNAHRHLRSGGRLFLALFNPDVRRLTEVNGLMELADRWEDEEAGTSVIKWSVRTVDWAAQLQDTLFIYEELLADGSVRRTACPFTLRFLWQHEVELMLQAAGFQVEAVWGDFQCNPYDDQAESLLLLAQK